MVAMITRFLRSRSLELGAEALPPDTGPTRGLLVVDIARGSGAAASDLRTANLARQRGRFIFSGGDIITAVDDEPIFHRDDLLIAIDNAYRPGDEVTLTVERLEEDGVWRERQNSGAPGSSSVKNSIELSRSSHIDERTG